MIHLSVPRRWLNLSLAACVVGVCFSIAAPAAADEQRFPDVVEVKVTARGVGVYDFDVTVSSPYDTPKRYADAFRVMTESGQVLGERKLLHDHQGEQPFTRDLHGVEVPADVSSVVVQARDQKYGYGGGTLTVKIPPQR